MNIRKIIGPKMDSSGTSKVDPLGFNFMNFVSFHSVLLSNSLIVECRVGRMYKFLLNYFSRIGLYGQFCIFKSLNYEVNKSHDCSDCRFSFSKARKKKRVSRIFDSLGGR